MSDAGLVFPNSNWELSTPADAGLDPLALKAISQVLAGPGSNANALVVVRRGKIVWEQYFEGTGSQDRHHLFSITKSVISSLVGVALRRGEIQSVEQPISDFFPGTNPAASPLSQLTVRHLLTMTTGMTWPRGSWAREPMIERMRLSPDWSQFILSLPIRRQEIGVFHYASASSHLLSVILTRATGINACAYAGRHLFGPLGIQPVISGADWETDPNHNTLGGWGLHLTARELARFGWLYICSGLWKGEEILPPGWVAESTQMQNGARAVYGYQWWLRQVAGEPVFAGLGAGGQFLFCLPRMETVVVILSRFARRWPDRWDLLERLLAQAGPTKG
jgi:CubicO group peptidase (beta-lactamase class C family)